MAVTSNVREHHVRIQKNERTAAFRTLYFFCDGTLPANATISTNGGDEAASTAAPVAAGDMTGHCKLVLTQAETNYNGYLTVKIVSTVDVNTVMIYVELTKYGPILEGAITDVGLAVQSAR